PATAVSPISNHGGPGGSTDQRSNTSGPGASLIGMVTVQKEWPSAPNECGGAGNVTDGRKLNVTDRCGRPVATSNVVMTVWWSETYPVCRSQRTTRSGRVRRLIQ